VYLLAVLAAAAAVSSPAPACARGVPDAPAGLPGPLVVTTSCAAFTILPTGHVEAASPSPSVPAWVPVGAFTTGDGVYWASDEGHVGHLVALRDGVVVWRSAGRYRIYEVAAVLGRHSVAFADRRSLYVASLDGAERRVGAREQPAGWTSAGELLTVRAGSVVLRSRDGELVGRVAAAVGSWTFDESTRTLLYVSRQDELVRTDGRSSRVLADLGAFGLRFGNAWIQTLAGGLVGVLDGHRVAAFRADGSLLGRASFGRGLAVAGTSGLVAGPGGVAFTVTHGTSGGRGTEDVYALRGGGRSTRLLHERLAFAGCGRWADLAWRGDWLLYAATEGRVAIVDAAAPGTSLDLTRFVRALPGVDLAGENGPATRFEWLMGRDG